MLLLWLKEGHEIQFEDELPVVENDILKVGKKIIQLEKVSGFKHVGKEYFVYTGHEYIEQVEADYEAFGEEADEVPFRELDRDSSWSRAKWYKNDAIVVCDGMLGDFGIIIVMTSLFGSLPIKIRSILIYTSYVSENNKGHKEK